MTLKMICSLTLRIFLRRGKVYRNSSFVQKAPVSYAVMLLQSLLELDDCLASLLRNSDIQLRVVVRS